jgi:KTSC domain
MRVAVDSATLATVAYDKARELLQLQFCSRATYLYFGVPPAVHEALLEAPSKGRYFNKTIRGRYAYRPAPDLCAVPQGAEVAARCDR